MSSRDLFVVGATGLVGSTVAELGRKQGREVHGAARSAGADQEADFSLPETARSLLAPLTPRQAVLLCAAYSHVDGCESDPTTSLRYNVDLVRRIADATPPTTPIVFFSSDQVFDGSLPAHRESDPVNPMNVYARHKCLAEEILLARDNTLVVRTAWVFGAERRRKNFLYRVVDAAQGSVLRLPREQAGCPTSARWLAESTLQLLDQGVHGVVHLTGGVPFTKAAWARTIAAGLGLRDLAIEEVDWLVAGQVAPRPARVVLATERHGLIQPPVAELLADLEL